jgi:hypothetical protein
MKKLVRVLLVLASISPLSAFSEDAIIIDHGCTRITAIPASALANASASLKIAYGHTSHGSQLITGMDVLVTSSARPRYNGTGSAADALEVLRDLWRARIERSRSAAPGLVDTETWERATRQYLSHIRRASHNVVLVRAGGMVLRGPILPTTCLDERLGRGLSGRALCLYDMSPRRNRRCGEPEPAPRADTQVLAATTAELYVFGRHFELRPGRTCELHELFANDNCDYEQGRSSHNWAIDWQPAPRWHGLV